MKFQFFPYDITYKVVGDSPIIFMVGRTREGKKVTVVDKNFRPYFYVQTKNKDLLKPISEKILKLEAEARGTQAKVTEVKEVTKNIISKPRDLLQVFTNIPKGVPVIRDIIKEWDDVESTYEYDILFVRKYLVDKQLTPLTSIKVK